MSERNERVTDQPGERRRTGWRALWRRSFQAEAGAGVSERSDRRASGQPGEGPGTDWSELRGRSSQGDAA